MPGWLQRYQFYHLQYKHRDTHGHTLLAEFQQFLNSSTSKKDKCKGGLVTLVFTFLRAFSLDCERKLPNVAPGHCATRLTHFPPPKPLLQRNDKKCRDHLMLCIQVHLWDMPVNYEFWITWLRGCLCVFFMKVLLAERDLSKSSAVVCREVSITEVVASDSVRFFGFRAICQASAVKGLSIQQRPQKVKKHGQPNFPHVLSLLPLSSHHLCNCIDRRQARFSICFGLSSLSIRSNKVTNSFKCIAQQRI